MVRGNRAVIEEEKLYSMGEYLWCTCTSSSQKNVFMCLYQRYGLFYCLLIHIFISIVLTGCARETITYITAFSPIVTGSMGKHSVVRPQIF